MNDSIPRNVMVLGGCLLTGLVALGLILGNAAMRVKSLERTVAVKGLSEREVPADIAIWPLTFREASNDLNGLFETIQRKNAQIVEFLAGHGIAREAITISPPAIMARHAQAYGDTANIMYRYSGGSTVTVYSNDVEALRNAMKDVIALGKKGVALSGEDYQGQTQFVFSGLATLKPGMIEEAREVLRTLAFSEKQIAATNGRWFSVASKAKPASWGLTSIRCGKPPTNRSRKSTPRSQRVHSKTRA